MQTIEFSTVEAFAAWCAEVVPKGLAFRAREKYGAGFVVEITGH